MASGWYYFKPHEVGGQPTGPVSWEQLVLSVRSGALAPDDSVWHAALSGWLPAVKIRGLFPTRRRSPLVWIVPLAGLVVVGLILGLVLGLRDGDENPPVSITTSTSMPTASSTVPTTPTSSTAQGEADTWLIMIYANADDEILEEDTYFDVNEAEVVGSTDKVKIVVQLDRYAGGYAGGGDVTSTKRYLLVSDSDLYTINSPEVADLGEVDMGDDRSLYDFATWAIGAYPAEHRALILGDHGGGWTGGWTDDAPVPGSRLSMQEIDAALGAVVADTGIGALDLVGFDACLMGQLEVMSAIAPHARYAVASAETEPAIGWGYAGFLWPLTDDPSMTGRELSGAILDSYISQDVRITDPGARRGLTGGEYAAEDVVTELSLDATLAGIELGAIQDLDAAVNELAVALTGIDQELVAQARTYAQSYASVFGDDLPPSFIDLEHFVDLLLTSVDDADVLQAAERVTVALDRAVIAEVHGQERPACGGLSIYFPNTAEYVGTFGAWDASYTSFAGRFATASLWDDYLTFHYTGKPFDPGSADLSVVTPAQAALTDFAQAAKRSAPAENATIAGPGAGGLTIAPISVSATEIAVDEALTVSTRVTGSNIAYIYYYVGYYWEKDGSYLSADAGFIEPGNVKEVGGIYYPDWSQDGLVSVEFDWKPTLYFMSDGNEANDQFAFFSPTVYGADRERDIYSVRGTYVFVDSGTRSEAEIDFSGSGDMLSVWAFSGSDGASGVGTWHEITPHPGDTFTITDEYLEFDKDPDGRFADYDGGTMTFGDTPFTMLPYSAFPGEYALGIGVEDLDGNVTWDFAEVVVTK